jgi:hypothetical protein
VFYCGVNEGQEESRESIETRAHGPINLSPLVPELSLSVCCVGPGIKLGHGRARHCP